MKLKRLSAQDRTNQRFYIKADYANRERRHHQTGLIDDRGRSIGFSSSVMVQSLEPVNLDTAPHTYSFACYDLPAEPAITYLAVVQPTRDGVDFGASQSGAVFTTREEAENYIEKRVEESTKSYAKKYARDN